MPVDRLFLLITVNIFCPYLYLGVIVCLLLKYFFILQLYKGWGFVPTCIYRF